MSTLVHKYTSMWVHEYKHEYMSTRVQTCVSSCIQHTRSYKHVFLQKYGQQSDSPRFSFSWISQQPVHSGLKRPFCGHRLLASKRSILTQYTKLDGDNIFWSPTIHFQNFFNISNRSRKNNFSTICKTRWSQWFFVPNNSLSKHFKYLKPFAKNLQIAKFATFDFPKKIHEKIILA